MTLLEGYSIAPQLHKAVGQDLYFVRLLFEPVYPDVRDRLRARLIDAGVGSAHVYELIGGYDLLLRVWHRGDIRSVVEGLDLPEMRRADFMTVRRQHAYLGEDRRDEVSVTLDDARDLAARARDGLERDEVDEFVRRGVLFDIFGRPGIKFMVAVSASIGSSSSISFDDVLFKYVSKILEQAHDIVRDRSVYAGDGFARILLMGRIAEEDYFAFMERVVLPLSDEYMRELFSGRTATALGTRPDPILAIENLADFENGPVGPAPGRTPIRELLERGESQHLEVKASAFLNFDRYVNGQDPDWSSIRPEFVKAVAGLLNQVDGERGTLIVGALESSRYRTWLDGRPEPLGEIGEFALVGLEEDHPSGDWDVYQRRLMDALDKALRPSPVPYLTAVLETVVVGTAAPRMVLRLEVSPQARAFYDQRGDVLWVRTGAQVRSLVGPDRDDFVSAIGRGAN